MSISTKNKNTSIIKKIFKSTKIHNDPVLQRNSKLLAIVNLFLLIAFGTLHTFSIIFDPSFSTSIIHIFGFIILISSYSANYLGYYKFGSISTVLMVPIVALSRVAFDKVSDPAIVLCFLPLSLIFASMLLSLWQTTIIALLQIILVSLIPIINPSAIIIGSSEHIDVIAINSIAGILIFLAISHRDKIEDDRQVQLKSSEELFRTFAEQAILGVAVIAKDKFTFVNEAFANIFGYKIDELIKWEPEVLYKKLIHPEYFSQVYEQAKKKQMGLQNGITPHYRWKGLNKNKDTIWIESFSKHISYGEEGADLIMLIDITSSIDAEEKNLLMIEALHKTDKMKAIGELAGGIAHDINNQLAGIVGSANLLLLDHDNKFNHEDLANNILKSSKRSSELIDQLLAFASKGKFFQVNVDINELIIEVIELLNRSLSKKIIVKEDFKIEKATTLGDPSMLQNVILNLCLNARDAMQNGGKIYLSTEKVLLEEKNCKDLSSLLKPGEYIRLKIEDTGKGMEPEVTKRIFEPFFTTKEKGIGMGLAAVWGTINSHNGSIDVTSILDQGSCFTIHLPYIDVNTPKAINPKKDVQHHKIKSKILIIDDEDIVRNTAGSIIKFLGHEATLCKDGSGAIDIYEKNWKNFDMVILDMIMPGMGGSEVYEELHKINPEVKILLSSGYSIDSGIQKLLDKGANGFIQKPFLIDDLRIKISEILDI